MKISNLKILGSHNSTSYGIKFPMSIFSKCQNIDIEDQLAIGVRFFDIRLNLDNGTLQCYHGITKCNISWKELMTIYKKFLTKYPKEFILLRVLRADDQTGKRKTSDDDWYKSFYEESTNITITDEDLNVDDIKGKIVVINLNWKTMIKQMFNDDWKLKYEIDTLIKNCNNIATNKTNDLKIIYTNAQGGFKFFKNIPLLKKIPRPYNFFKLFRKRISEIKIENGIYVFDFVDKINYNTRTNISENL